MGQGPAPCAWLHLFHHVNCMLLFLGQRAELRGCPAEILPAGEMGVGIERAERAKETWWTGGWMDRDFEAALHLGTYTHAVALSQTVEELWRKRPWGFGPEEQKSTACKTVLFDVLIVSLCILCLLGCVCPSVIIL